MSSRCTFALDEFTRRFNRDVGISLEVNARLTGFLRRVSTRRNFGGNSAPGAVKWNLLSVFLKTSAAGGITMLLIEALFRINLAKHIWLVIVQLIIALVVVGCLILRGSYLRAGVPPKARLEPAGRPINWKGSSPESAGNTYARDAAKFFGMSGPAEFVAAAVLFLLLLALILVYLLRPRINSDEPQHLHVIWSWTRGLVQYRDLFDNHMPLFHILFAPIAALIGERPTILYWMRFILLPAYFVSAWCAYEIGKHLFSRRVGIWAVISVGLFTGYYYDAIDFRPNNLWLALWLLCITVLVRGTLDVRRALAGGLLLGLCFGVSMKSAAFLLALLTGAASALVLIGRKQLGKSWADILATGVAFLAGAVPVPAAIMIFFAQKDLWPDFHYCVFDFNFLTDRIYERHLLYKTHPFLAVAIFLALLPAVGYVARWISAVTRDPGLAFGRVFLLIVCAAYYLALHVFWPPISRTYPPIYPLCFVLLTGALIAASHHLAFVRGKMAAILRRLPLPALLSLAEFFILITARPTWKLGRGTETDLLRGVLALTKPSDYVFDAKGETIFRRRCFRPILERITMKAIRRGLVADDGAERLVATRTCVVGAMFIHRFPEATRNFVEQNYLQVGHNLRVAGAPLKPSPEHNRFDFNVVVPASYQIISPSGEISGTLDGTICTGARFLDAGPHTFQATSESNELVLLWSRAVERNFTPFASAVR